MTNGEFSKYVDELYSQTKKGKLPREERFKAIEELTDRYIEENGKRPESSQLDRLATLCLYEEMVDNRRNKMQAEESPIMSGNQYRRRTEGKHIRKGAASGEVTLKRAMEYGQDHRNHGYPSRRQWSVDEALSVDSALSRNPAMAERYVNQSANGEVVSRNVD